MPPNRPSRGDKSHRREPYGHSSDSAQAKPGNFTPGYGRSTDQSGKPPTRSESSPGVLSSFEHTRWRQSLPSQGFLCGTILAQVEPESYRKVFLQREDSFIWIL
jgi:hypothetical protein